MNNRYNEFQSFLKPHNKKFIQYCPVYARITGSSAAAVMLSQIIFYWGLVHRERRSELGENEFSKTDKKFMEEIHMNSSEFICAQNILEELRIITMKKKKGCPPRTFYKLNERILRGFISSGKKLTKKQMKGFPKIEANGYRICIIRENTHIRQHVTGFLPNIEEIDKMILFLHSLKDTGQDAINKHNQEHEEIEQRRFKAQQQKPGQPRRRLPKKDTSGYVYFLSSAGYVKIGKTHDLDDRISSLSMSTPLEVKLLHYVKSEDIHKDEQAFHNMFATKRVKGEWFKLNEDDIEKIRAIREK